MGIIDECVPDVFVIFDQKLLVLRNILPLFMGDKVKARAVETRVNNVI